MPYPYDIIRAPSAEGMGQGYDLGLYPQFADLLQNIAASHRAKKQFELQMQEKAERDALTKYTKEREYGREEPFPATIQSEVAVTPGSPMNLAPSPLAAGLTGPREELARNLATQQGRPIPLGLAARGSQGLPSPAAPVRPAAVGQTQTVIPGGTRHVPGLRDVESKRKLESDEERLKYHEEIIKLRQDALAADKDKFERTKNEQKAKDIEKGAEETFHKIYNEKIAPYRSMPGGPPRGTDQLSQRTAWAETVAQHSNKVPDLALVGRASNAATLHAIIEDKDTSGISRRFAVWRLQNEFPGQ